jgi:hypothetical protein
MALPVVFATLPAGNEPLSLMDTQSAALGALGVIPCSAAGQNTIVLTPNANTPTIPGYTDLAPSFSYVAAQTSTGSVTINAAGFGARNAYKWNGQQAMGAGDSVAGSVYKATFLTALNAGSGGFVVDAVGTANNTADVEFIIDGGGVVIATGVKGFLHLPFSATVLAWRVMADQSGSIAIDVLRANGAVPTVSMVGGGNKPTLTAQQFNQAQPSGWTSIALVTDDWIGFNVVSATTVTRVTVDLTVAKI